MVDGTVEGKDNREEKTREVTNIKMYTISWNYLYLGCGYGGWHEFFYIFLTFLTTSSIYRVVFVGPLPGPTMKCVCLDNTHPQGWLKVHYNVWNHTFKYENIAKGTTDPRVEFCLPKKQNLTQILIKFQHSKSFDQTLTTKSWPNIHFITSPSLSSKILTKLQFQKFRLNFNFKLLAKPCAQSLNKI